jgi:hypothetical protein
MAGGPGNSDGSSALFATVGAGAMIAQQVILKASRDAFFLTHFGAERLPIAMTIGAMLSGLVIVAASSLFLRKDPARVVPAAFLASSIAIVLEWVLYAYSDLAATVIVYLHVSAFGATLVSAFWSLINDVFDPHTARRMIGRAAAGAALGGLGGGVLATIVSRVAPMHFMLLLAASFGFAAGIAIAKLSRRVEPHRGEPSQERASGVKALHDTPYLRNLALLVLLGAMTQALLDFAIGAEAVERYGSGGNLLSFYAVLQTVIGLGSFVVQIAASDLLLERLGIGRTISMLPIGVIGVGAIWFASPSVLVLMGQRALESVLRGSIFRSAYEVLFTPIERTLKRSAKALIDVGFDRLGTVLGSGATMAIAAYWPAERMRVVIGFAMLVSAGAIAIAAKLHFGYVATLAERLRTGVLRLDPGDAHDATTRRTLSETIDAMDRPTLLAQIEALRSDAPRTPIVKTSAFDPSAASFGDLPPRSRNADDDPLASAVAGLRSNDAERIRAVLRTSGALIPLLSPLVLVLLDRVDVGRDAMLALRPFASRMIGQLADALIDDALPDRARRRVARLLAGGADQRALDSLAMVIDRSSLLLRSTVARSMIELLTRNPRLRVDREALIASASRALDGALPGSSEADLAIDLLSIAYAKEPMQLARGALRSGDPELRGVALEYIDAVLTPELRHAMRPLFEGSGSGSGSREKSTRMAAEIADDLFHSKDVIAAVVAEAAEEDS